MEGGVRRGEDLEEMMIVGEKLEKCIGKGSCDDCRKRLLQT